MKPYLLFILVLILVLAALASCMYTNLSNDASQAEATQINTAPVVIETSGVSPTIEAASSAIFYDLNMTIEGMETSTKFNALEHITGASYQVVGVDFPDTNNAQVFRVKTRCECAGNAQCCSPMRTLIVTLIAMDSSNNIRIPQTVDNVATISTMQVWCYDHANLTDVMSLSWTDVKEFLNGNLTGFQLAYKVTPQPH